MVYVNNFRVLGFTINGLWFTVYGLRLTVNSLWFTVQVMVYGLRFYGFRFYGLLFYGLQFYGLRLRFMVRVLQFMVRGLRFQGLRLTIYGLQSWFTVLQFTLTVTVTVYSFTVSVFTVNRLRFTVNSLPFMVTVTFYGLQLTKGVRFRFCGFCPFFWCGSSAVLLGFLGRLDLIETHDIDKLSISKQKRPSGESGMTSWHQQCQEECLCGLTETRSVIFIIGVA